MVQQRFQRKLAAVLVTDVAGYSRLMELDEETTHRRLTALQRELVGPKVREYRGSIVKSTGDGALVEFASVVDAVQCAVEIQRHMIGRNSDAADDRHIKLRIGINLGDIIEETGDIYGDGVNIAARLEGLAEPGGLCISGTSYDQVRDKVEHSFEDKGEVTVKNISRPVRVYALSAGAIAALPVLPSTPASSPSRLRGIFLAASVAGAVVVTAGLWLGMKSGNAPQTVAAVPRLSMVVLPFANLSGDRAQDYLADVVTEGLTTALSRIKNAFVIARSTAFTYKGKPVDVKKIGKELGVRYALEGSTQYSGGKIRVNAQLIDAESGAHLWADQFDADRPDLLDMQDEIVVRLSRALAFQFIDFDAARIKRMRPENVDAQDLAMQCLSKWHISGETEAIDLCQRALRLDGRNVIALSMAAFAAIYPVITSQSDDPTEAVKRADDLASQALAVDPGFDGAHSTKAWVLMAKGRHEDAIVEAEKCLALNPSAVEAFIAIGTANNFLARPEQSLEAIERAVRLSPRDPFLWGFYEVRGEAFFIKRQDDSAIEWIRRSEALAPQSDPYGRLMLISAAALSGKQAQASDALKAYLEDGRARSRTISQFQKQQLSMASNPNWIAYNERFADGLRKAGLPE